MEKLLLIPFFFTTMFVNAQLTVTEIKDLSSGNFQKALKYLGSPILAETVGQNLLYSNTSSSLVDGQTIYIGVYLPTPKTLTGIKVYPRTVGAYTANNNNRIGLYSYSGGTLTLVASSANSGTLWTSASTTVQNIPFSATYNAVEGLYFVALLYNHSAQTTAPALAGGVITYNLSQTSTAYEFTNTAKLFGTLNGTDLPATAAMSSILATGICLWVGLY